MCHSQGQCPGRGQRPDCPNLSVLINCVGISAHVRQCTHCSSELVCICQKYNHMPVNVPCGIIFHMVLCRKYRCTKNIQPRTAAHPGPTQLACSLRSHAYIHAEMTLQSQGACAEMDRLQKFHPSSLLRWGRDAAALISEGSQGNSRPCGQELCGHREARADILPNSTKIPPAPGALLFFFSCASAHGRCHGPLEHTPLLVTDTFPAASPPFLHADTRASVCVCVHADRFTCTRASPRMHCSTHAPPPASVHLSTRACARATFPCRCCCTCAHVHAPLPAQHARARTHARNARAPPRGARVRSSLHMHAHTCARAAR